MTVCSFVCLSVCLRSGSSICLPAIRCMPVCLPICTHPVTKESPGGRISPELDGIKQARLLHQPCADEVLCHMDALWRSGDRHLPV